MFDRLKKMFQEKDEKKKIENLVTFLIVLVITLIVVNKILANDNKNEKSGSNLNSAGVQFVNQDIDDTDLEKNIDKNEYGLEESLEDILSKIDGVRKSSSIINIFRKFKYFSNL